MPRGMRGQAGDHTPVASRRSMGLSVVRTSRIMISMGLFAQSPKKAYFTVHISFNRLIHMLL